MMRFTCKKLFTSFQGKLIFFIKELLLNPAISIPSILYPACGTFSISIFPLAPTNSTSVPVSFFRIALAIAMAGKICPPVPPPAMIIRLFIPLTNNIILVGFFCELNVHFIYIFTQPIPVHCFLPPPALALHSIFFPLPFFPRSLPHSV